MEGFSWNSKILFFRDLVVIILKNSIK